ncbi:hypothetical protein B0J12DRAFT_639344 [Macrophomina phaseolina]|uniref:Uncharacterized protein n=1 Tax=Macrophomina phaseolina TaxID=35725 RepID=A0ABQ8GVA1_9PEZI|nr:hypothetical protein B0J12DRAFT_639344 [Macrophomina phaseolina]
MLGLRMAAAAAATTTMMAVMRGSKREARGGHDDRESRLHWRRRRWAAAALCFAVAVVLTPCRLLWTWRRANVAKMHSTRAPGGLAGSAGLLLLLAAVQCGHGHGHGHGGLGAEAVVGNQSGASAGACAGGRCGAGGTRRTSKQAAVHGFCWRVLSWCCGRECDWER